MSVYVDNMQAPYGRMKMCHCWADTREELFEMMNRVGVKLKWFQRPDGACDFGMKASWEHFDISMSKRALAISCGAIEKTMLEMSIDAHRQQFFYRASFREWDRAAIELKWWLKSHTLHRKRVL